MAKINISDILSTSNMLFSLNNRFQQIEDELNNKVLYRDNPGTEANEMNNDLDMNGFQILNLPQPVDPTDPVRLQDILDIYELYTGLNEALAEVEQAVIDAAASAATALNASDLAGDAAVDAQIAEAAAEASAVSAAASAASVVGAIDTRVARFSSLEAFRASSFDGPEAVIEAANAGTTVGRMILKATGTTGAPATATGDRFSALAEDDELINEGGYGYALALGQPISPYTFGGSLGVDASTAAQLCITYAGATLGGGIITTHNHEFLINDANLTVEYDSVAFAFVKFKRTSTTTGFILSYGTTVDVSGGGVVNAKFTGLASVAGGNGGLRMGTDVYKASDYVLDNVHCTGFSQYGVGIEAGDNWNISNIRVTEHGLTSGTISSCMGFYLFPRIASSGGQLSNVYSQISDDCAANTSANTAAVKLQCHQKLAANNIVAVYGREEAMTIDSVDGSISDVLVYQQGTRPGLVLTSYNTAHAFSGQKFTLDGFEIRNGGSSNSNELVIAAAVDGQYTLDGCTIQNGKGGGSTFLNYSALKDCTFENLEFEDIRWSTAWLGFSVNSLSSSGNVLHNIVARGGTLTGTLVVEVEDSTLVDVGVSSKAGDTVSTLEIYGDNNQINAPFVHNCGSNAIKVTGSGNELHDVRLKDITGRSIWFPLGSDNNTVHSGNTYAGTGVLDSGTGNLVSIDGVTTATAANIASITSTINTRNKFTRKQVYDTTNNRLMLASGAAAADPWYISDGSASVTPA